MITAVLAYYAWPYFVDLIEASREAELQLWLELIQAAHLRGVLTDHTLASGDAYNRIYPRVRDLILGGEEVILEVGVL